jgi:WD40 repeat protein
MGTPSMAMSSDGRFGIIANHGWRPDEFQKLRLPAGPRTNPEITPEMLVREKFTAQYANVISLIDLSVENFPVVHRVLLEDFPIHVLRHPDGERFVIGGSDYFYFFKIVDSKLVEINRSKHPNGMPEFWITPDGKNLIATQSASSIPLLPGKAGQLILPQIHWYAIEGNNISHLSEVKVRGDLDTEILPETHIVRVSNDGKIALICQRSNNSGKDFSDILIADLTLEKPQITGFIEDAADGIESFAFHPNGKMAVATGLGTYDNAIVVLDIASKPVRVLYTMDVKGISQGIEFTPEGDKLFVGSAITGRIEVFDVLGDYELRKNPKFLNVGFGHNSLTIGPRYKN